MSRLVSQGVRDLAEQMVENPHDWSQGQYHFRNKTNPDIQVWTANGSAFIKLEGNDGLNFFEKRYLNRAIKQSIANKVCSKCKGVKNE